MRKMPDESVQCCVTSPPYFGLRDYGHPGQIGQEETPESFVQAMVEVFREVRRVLKNDGTCWLNLGDTYAGSNKGSAVSDAACEKLKGDTSAPVGDGGKRQTWTQMKACPKIPPGFKRKEIFGIPWRVAFALQADGWYLRQDIIWAKPNPMPESVTDRCTKAHEYLFLLTKSDRYLYDHEAVKEDGANKRSVWTTPSASFKGAHFATFPPRLIRPCIMAGTKPGDVVLDPFGGSGTTGQVALELGRRAILCELNPEYVEIIHRRCNVNMRLAL
jgi:site-specific DNA-methyltransferase (adenine-specific)